MFGLARRGWFGIRETVPAKAASAGLNLAASDVDELARIGALVAAEYGLSSPAVLSANLTRLIRRQVPVRGLHAAAVRSIGGLQFADGTVVLVRGRRVGDLGRVAVGLQFGSVHLDDFHADPDGVVLDVSYGGRHDQLCALGIARS
jgi:hypothetical protein